MKKKQKGQAAPGSGKRPKRPKYLMRLYVTGATPRSTRAITNLRRLCDENLDGHFELEVIDIYQQPGLARESQIIAAPTLIKTLPLPLRKFIGDMSDTKTLLAGLEILAASPSQVNRSIEGRSRR
ncbi:MAG TPA: circadian clock KaiB family protein [Candidatus Limnocylindrales bacterium]|nr:circadian clock KaiB family protein [Candidatus Limnocylindrales bacterium]